MGGQVLEYGGARGLAADFATDLPFPCPSTSLEIAQHMRGRVRPRSGMLTWKLLLVELPRKLGNVENPQASDRNDIGWPWASHFTSLGLSFFICKVGTRCLPPLWVETIPVKLGSYSPTNVNLSSFPGSHHQIESDQLTTDYCIGPCGGWGSGGPSHPRCSFRW